MKLRTLVATATLSFFPALFGCGGDPATEIDIGEARTVPRDFSFTTDATITKPTVVRPNYTTPSALPNLMWNSIKFEVAVADDSVDAVLFEMPNGRKAIDQKRPFTIRFNAVNGQHTGAQVVKVRARRANNHGAYSEPLNINFRIAQHQTGKCVGIPGSGGITPGQVRLISSDASSAQSVAIGGGRSIAIPARESVLLQNKLNRFVIQARGKGTLERVQLNLGMSGLTNANQITSIELRGPDKTTVVTVPNPTVQPGFRGTFVINFSPLITTAFNGKAAQGQWLLRIKTTAAAARLTNYSLTLTTECRETAQAQQAVAVPTITRPSFGSNNLMWNSVLVRATAPESVDAVEFRLPGGKVVLDEMRPFEARFGAKAAGDGAKTIQARARSAEDNSRFSTLVSQPVFISDMQTHRCAGTVFDDGTKVAAVYSSDAQGGDLLPVRTLRLLRGQTNRVRIIVRGRGTIRTANLLLVINNLPQGSTTDVRLTSPGGGFWSMNRTPGAEARTNTWTKTGEMTSAVGQSAKGQWNAEIVTTAKNAILTDFALLFDLSDCDLSED